jgi:hypothetical protein
MSSVTGRVSQRVHVLPVHGNSDLRHARFENLRQRLARVEKPPMRPLMAAFPAFGGLAGRVGYTDVALVHFMSAEPTKGGASTGMRPSECVPV